MGLSVRWPVGYTHTCNTIYIRSHRASIIICRVGRAWSRMCPPLLDSRPRLLLTLVNLCFLLPTWPREHSSFISPSSIHHPIACEIWLKIYCSEARSRQNCLRQGVSSGALRGRAEVSELPKQWFAGILCIVVVIVVVILTLTYGYNAVRGHRTGSKNSGAEDVTMHWPDLRGPSQIVTPPKTWLFFCRSPSLQYY